MAGSLGVLGLSAKATSSAPPALIVPWGARLGQGKPAVRAETTLEKRRVWPGLPLPHTPLGAVRAGRWVSSKEQASGEEHPALYQGECRCRAACGGLPLESRGKCCPCEQRLRQNRRRAPDLAGAGRVPAVPPEVFLFWVNSILPVAGLHDQAASPKPGSPPHLDMSNQTG